MVNDKLLKITMLVQKGYGLNRMSDKFPETFHNKQINQITYVTVFADYLQTQGPLIPCSEGQIPFHAAVAAR
jgi:hypothetical protein